VAACAALPSPHHKVANLVKERQQSAMRLDVTRLAVALVCGMQLHQGPSEPAVHVWPAITQHYQ